MILLDTNVLSELMKAERAPQVLRWFDKQPRAQIFTSAVSQAEILYGIELLPEGRRRSEVESAANLMFKEKFAGRVWAFDSSAAREFALIFALRKLAGRPISQFDAQIAAIARSNRASLATRNISDFAGCSIQLVNPWTAA